MKQIILVQWDDSATEVDEEKPHAWYDVVTVKASFRRKNRLLCTTVGYILIENSEAIVLTMSKSSSECGPHIEIPKSAIRSRVVLWPVKGRGRK